LFFFFFFFFVRLLKILQEQKRQKLIHNTINITKPIIGDEKRTRSVVQRALHVTLPFLFNKKIPSSPTKRNGELTLLRPSCASCAPHEWHRALLVLNGKTIDSSPDIWNTRVQRNVLKTRSFPDTPSFSHYWNAHETHSFFQIHAKLYKI
jgi:hypothetical protein